MNTEEAESVTAVKRGLDSPTLTCVLTEICINLYLLSAKPTKARERIEHSTEERERGADPSVTGLQNSARGTHPARLKRPTLSHLVCDPR